MALQFHRINAIAAATVVAVTTAIIVTALYFVQFHGELSINSNDWANFGSYLGGTLSPLFAFLAFVLGLCTINQSRQQARRDDLLKTIQSYERDFEVCIGKPVTCKDPWIWGNDLDAACAIQELPLRSLLYYDGIDWEQHLPDVAVSINFRILSDGELIQDRDIWLRAHLAVEGIFRYLELYKKAGGEASLINYFVDKYEIPRNRLSSCRY